LNHYIKIPTPKFTKLNCNFYDKNYKNTNKEKGNEYDYMKIHSYYEKAEIDKRKTEKGKRKKK